MLILVHLQIQHEQQGLFIWRTSGFDMTLPRRLLNPASPPSPRVTPREAAYAKLPPSKPADATANLKLEPPSELTPRGAAHLQPLLQHLLIRDMGRLHTRLSAPCRQQLNAIETWLTNERLRLTPYAPPPLYPRLGPVTLMTDTFDRLPHTTLHPQRPTQVQQLDGRALPILHDIWSPLLANIPPIGPRKSLLTNSYVLEID